MPTGFSINKTLYPFESRWVDMPCGARVHYVDEGHGPVLLLLHGNPTWSFLYRDIIAGLKDRFRCVAPDYPGFGLSSEPTGFGFTAKEQADVLAEFVHEIGRPVVEPARLIAADGGTLHGDRSRLRLDHDRSRPL